MLNKNRLQKNGTVVALGCFDGVHIGHTAVILKAIEEANKRGVLSAVWCFEEPPRNFFSPMSVPIITSVKKKCDIIRSLGIDLCVCVPFDDIIKNTSARDFLDRYVSAELGACHVVCGFNYSFGKNGEGDSEFLKRYCKEKGIGLTILPPTRISESTVSSSLIRALVENGEVESAEKYLGRPYSIEYRVVEGKKLARKWGTPTLNQLLDKKFLTPRKGVYLVKVSFDDFSGFGISNVGTRPTVNEKVLSAETHIFDFDGDLYGKTVTVEFLKFIRPEKEFASIDELSAQILKDIATAKDMIKK